MNQQLPHLNQDLGLCNSLGVHRNHQLQWPYLLLLLNRVYDEVFSRFISGVLRCQERHCLLQSLGLYSWLGEWCMSLGRLLRLFRMREVALFQAEHLPCPIHIRSMIFFLIISKHLLNVFRYQGYLNQLRNLEQNNLLGDYRSYQFQYSSFLQL